MNGSQYRGVTPLDGIKAASKGGELLNQQILEEITDKLVVTYAKGCERWSNDQSGFAEAVQTASAADVAVVVVGTWSASTLCSFENATNTSSVINFSSGKG